MIAVSALYFKPESVIPEVGTTMVAEVGRSQSLTQLVPQRPSAHLACLSAVPAEE